MNVTLISVLRDQRFVDALTSLAPLSPFTGKPLALVDIRAVDQIMPWQFQNCLEPEWWFGQDTANYTHQIRVDIDPILTRSAAERAGLLTSDLEVQISDWSFSIEARRTLLSDASKRAQALSLRGILTNLRLEREKNPAWGSKKYPASRIAEIETQISALESAAQGAQ